MPFVEGDLEFAKVIEHPFGKVYEIARTDKYNVALARITDDYRHHHKIATEIYHFISGMGKMELDDQVIDVFPNKCIIIEPFTKHRAYTAKGAFEILVVSSPPFDPKDVFYDRD